MRGRCERGLLLVTGQARGIAGRVVRAHGLGAMGGGESEACRPGQQQDGDRHDADARRAEQEPAHGHKVAVAGGGRK